MLVRVCSRYAFWYRPCPSGPAAVPAPPQGGSSDGPRIGLFVDSPDHLSGVARTLGNWQREAERTGIALHMHGTAPRPHAGGPMTVFPAVGTFGMTAYDGLLLHVPPLRDVVRYVRQAAFDVVHLSTPGPMGLAGLLAARLNGLPVVSTFHTHFPSYAARLFKDPSLEELTWMMMRWFYRQMDMVAAPTPTIRNELIARGCLPHKVRVVGRGVDTARFHPRHRNPALRDLHSHQARCVLLYVGRLSEEKNLPLLVDAFTRLAGTRRDMVLWVVGDGPYRARMESQLTGLPVHFFGVLHGASLSEVYASADAFVFPSETDTLGNVVLEAQASGLPVIVSDVGGPKDCIRDGVTGLVIPAITAEKLAYVVGELFAQPVRRHDMGTAARAYSQRFTHAASFEAFRRLHDDAIAARAARTARA